jgi:hypothetical protein
MVWRVLKRPNRRSFCWNVYLSYFSCNSETSGRVFGSCYRVGVESNWFTLMLTILVTVATLMTVCSDFAIKIKHTAPPSGDCQSFFLFSSSDWHDKWLSRVPPENRWDSYFFRSHYRFRPCPFHFMISIHPTIRHSVGLMELKKASLNKPRIRVSAENLCPQSLFMLCDFTVCLPYPQFPSWLFVWLWMDTD